MREEFLLSSNLNEVRKMRKAVASTTSPSIYDDHKLRIGSLVVPLVSGSLWKDKLTIRQIRETEGICGADERGKYTDRTELKEASLLSSNNLTRIENFPSFL